MTAGARWSVRRDHMDGVGWWAHHPGCTVAALLADIRSLEGGAPGRRPSAPAPARAGDHCQWEPTWERALAHALARTRTAQRARLRAQNTTGVA